MWRTFTSSQDFFFETVSSARSEIYVVFVIDMVYSIL